MPARRLALPAAGLALGVVLTGCGSGSHGADHGASSSVASVTSGAAAGGSASAVSASTSRQGDIAFAQAMIPHHQQAIEMSDLALKNAGSAAVKALATQIKGAQDPEIATMRGWLTAWGAAESMDHSGHGAAGMPGMMSDTDLATLGASRAAEFDRLWLTMMIAHHEGALTMAEQVLATTQDPAVKALAQAVVTGQTAEITTMKGLLGG